MYRKSEVCTGKPIAIYTYYLEAELTLKHGDRVKHPLTPNDVSCLNAAPSMLTRPSVKRGSKGNPKSKKFVVQAFPFDSESANTKVKDCMLWREVSIAFMHGKCSLCHEIHQQTVVCVNSRAVGQEDPK